MVFGQSKKLQDELFCITEERDFFQSKYLEQVSEIANLKEELRLARNEINRLRNTVMMGGGGGCSTTITNGSRGEDGFKKTLPTKKISKSSRPSKIVTMTPPQQEGESDKEEVEEQCSTTCSHSSMSSVSTSSGGGEDDDEDYDDNNDNRPIRSNYNCHGLDDLEYHQSSPRRDNDEGTSESEDQEEAVDIRQSAEKLLQWASYRSSTYRSSSHYSPPKLSVLSPSSSSPSNEVNKDNNNNNEPPHKSSNEEEEDNENSDQQQPHLPAVAVIA